MTTDNGQEIDTQTAVTQESQQAEVKPLTTEEQMATLQQEMNEVKSRYEQADKGLRSAQATLTQKDRLLKEKENVRDEIQTLKNMVKILATRPQSSDSFADDLEATARKPSVDIDKQFKELEDRQKAQEYQRQLQGQIGSFQQRVETLGLKEDDEAYWEIYKLVTSATPADFRLADIRLKKLEKENTPVDNKPTDDKTLETMQKEISRLKDIISGKLDTETGLPAGASANEAQIRKAFRDNSRNPQARKDYMELMATKRK